MTFGRARGAARIATRPGRPHESTRGTPSAARRWRRGLAVLAAVVVGALAAGCSPATGRSATGIADPEASISPQPDYPDLCAPVGLDTSVTCLRLILGAIDAARAKEGVGPMVLPSDFAGLSVAEQLFVAVDRERVDRGLAPFVGLTAALDTDAARGADAGALPPRPGPGYRYSDAEWIGDLANGLDADYQWMYFDGVGSGLPDCSAGASAGCWVDRHIVLDGFGSGRRLVMGVAVDPTGDRTPGDRGGPSLAATLAVADQPGGRFVYTWAEALAATRRGTLRPLEGVPADESDTGIPDPGHNVLPDPDYTSICAAEGVDDSSTCLGAVLGAFDHARALEGVRPMVLPTDFAQLSVPEQLFVAIDLERIDRGLAPFVGLTAALDANAARGADDANDPPDPGRRYLLVDSEWAGGSVNGLDAVYGWMYDDGANSGNLDCPHKGAAGCWGHRKGILDDFGSGQDLVMGAAFDPTGDTNPGDRGGTSMAVTLAVASSDSTPLVFTWAQALASLPPGASP